jgi:uncharacterized protein (TIGR03905 family)
MPETERYVFRTQGVCPPEIHFQIKEGILDEVDFRGGGCPGNAQLVSRLIKGRSIEEIRPYLKDIPCRNDTSCPDQLDRALDAVLKGNLLPARSFRLATDPWPKGRLALVGNLAGSLLNWESIRSGIEKEGIKDVYCLGGLSDPRADNHPLLNALRRSPKVLAILGEKDWDLAQPVPGGSGDSSAEEDRVYLSSLPQVLSFRLGERQGMAFYGRYLQDLPGYSDYEPFALEMNMVANLTQFMEDPSVFPALEAMTPQFKARVVIFGQAKRWGHWQVGGVDFVGVGPAGEDDRLRWGLLAVEEEQIKLEMREAGSTEMRSL